jgi:hypothetical protein
LGSEVIGTTTTYDAIAVFENSASSVACPGGTAIGSCCYEPPPATSTSGGTLPTEYSAGSLTIADDGSTIGTVAFGTVGYGSVGTPATFTWNGGDTLSVSAPGATIDSFSGTVKAPNAIAGLSSLTAIPVAGWTVTWTPDTLSGETMEVAVVDNTNSVDYGEASCSVPDSAGTVTLSSALLSHFKSGDTASVQVNRSAGSAVSSGNAAVHLLAGVTVGGSATLQ